MHDGVCGAWHWQLRAALAAPQSQHAAWLLVCSVRPQAVAGPVLEVLVTYGKYEAIPVISSAAEVHDLRADIVAQLPYLRGKPPHGFHLFLIDSYGDGAPTELRPCMKLAEAGVSDKSEILVEHADADSERLTRG